MPGQDSTSAGGQRLDLKALRLAVHGWWLGNPLIYKPGTADLCAVARELAGAGAASGALIVSDTPASGNRAVGDGGTMLTAEATRHDVVHSILILRPPIADSPLGMAAAQAVAEVAQTALGRPCAIRTRWQVVVGDGHGVASQLCHIAVDMDAEFSLVELRLALGRFRAASGPEVDQSASALFARPDWREVLLARTLHTLEHYLRASSLA